MTDQMIKQAVEVWAPNYPRNCAGLIGTTWGQVTVHGSNELIYNIERISGDYPSYVSTYSFPNGHPTKDINNIPKLDTLMIDFDFDFSKDEFNLEEWERKLSALLTRLRMVAKSLVGSGYDKYWRGSLSGFKGAHLYLDFPTIDEDLGDPEQYRNGMADFTSQSIRELKNETGIKDLDEYIDVSSGWDFSRLTRLPNTIHEKATKAFDENRFCVPVSIREMQQINVQTYTALTHSPREVPQACRRYPNNRTKKKIERYIKTASTRSRERYTSSVKSTKRYEKYKDKVVNDRVELEDVEFLLKRKPCIWAFHENANKFDQGYSSHVMEIQCILAMSSIGTPIDVMKEFFEHHPTQDVDPKYDEVETENRIKEVLSRDYNEFKCSSVLEESPQFCLKNDCMIYRDDNKLQNIN